MCPEGFFFPFFFFPSPKLKPKLLSADLVYAGRDYVVTGIVSSDCVNLRCSRPIEGDHGNHLLMYHDSESGNIQSGGMSLFPEKKVLITVTIR